MDNDRRQEDKEQGRFEGRVIQKLDNLQNSFNEMKKEYKEFKIDAYGKINKNTADIANQKGWMGAIGACAGIVGGFLKGMLFK